MKGLLYKDFITIATSYRANFLLVLVLYVGMAVMMDMPFMIYAMIFLLGMYPLSCLSFDENSHWDAYARTLPVTKAQLVGGKYLLELGFVAVGGGAAAVLGMVLDFVKGRDVAAALPANLAGCLASLVVVLLYYAISFPLSYKFGATKARSTVLLVMAALFGVGFLIVNSGLLSGLDFSVLNGISNFQGMLLLAGILAAALAVYLVSWRVSTAIYQRKEY